MQQPGVLRIAAFLAVIAVIVAAAFLMMQPGEDTTVIGEDEADTPIVSTYDSDVYGVHFTYPDSYVLAEHDAEGSALRARHTITLIDREAAAHIPENGEGPVAITIDIFGNNIDKQTLKNWIENTSASNFKLAIDQSFSTSTVAGTTGFSYVWDGLYRGESTVIAHKDNILMFTVTYMDSTDRIRDDFRSLLASVVLK